MVRLVAIINTDNQYHLLLCQLIVMSIVINFCGYQGERSVHTRAANVFCSSIRQYAGDSVTVNFEPNIVSKGHKAADLLVKTESGEIDGCYFSSSYLTDKVPELALFDQHFVVPSRRHAYAILDGSLGKRLATEVQLRTGLVVLGYWDNGLRHISSANGPIRTPDDCNGLKIRTLNSEDHRRVFNSLGFESMSIDVRDLPDAVKNSVVDAQENPLTNMYNFELHKVQKYITLSRHLLGVAPLFFNKAAVASWPGEVRDAVQKAVADATEEQRKYALEDDLTCREAMERDGCEFITLTEQERNAFVAASEPEVNRIRSGFEQELLDLFDADLATVS